MRAVLRDGADLQAEARALQEEPDARPRPAITKPTTPMRLQGSTRPCAISTPPASQSGFATATFWAPKIRRTVWIRPRLMPQVASSVSSGRP